MIPDNVSMKLLEQTKQVLDTLSREGVLEFIRDLHCTSPLSLYLELEILEKSLIKYLKDNL